MHVFYLHGFASSARSSKAAYLAARLGEHGVALHAPDFNEPDFATLTVSRMVEQVGRAIDALPRGPVALIGSSLGGFVAIQVALARPAVVDRLVLLAPALDFTGNRARGLAGSGLEEWQRTDTLPVFHYGYGRMMTVRYALRIYDRNVSIARLVGANKDYINTQIPHLSSLLCDTIDEVIEGSDVIVVGNGSPEFAEALKRTRPDQIVIDLFRVKADPREIPARYTGICW